METSDYTEEQLEQMLKNRKRANDKKRRSERKAYEKKRDEFVSDMMKEALHYNEILTKFKEGLHSAFEEHQEILNKYGEIRKNSKGGFSLTSSDGKNRVKRIRATAPQWDERSKKGEELIMDFLKQKIRSKKLHKLVMSFLQRDEKGNLEYSRVMNLLKMRHEWDDERWIEGLNLMEESYTIHFRAYGYVFEKRDEGGKWERVEMNFSSI